MPTLAEVDAYPVPELLIPRIMKNYDRSQEYAEGIVREAKRMLFLRWESNHHICPSVEIDDAWHEMILFTRWYAEFCEYIGGFVHHNPEPVAPPAQGTNEEGVLLYDETMENYRKIFGEEPDKRFWT